MKIYKEEEVIRWAIDEVQSRISFNVRHLMISHVKGEFMQFEAYVLTNGSDFTTADITLNIKSKSIDTGNSERDSKLRGSDFLSTQVHKQIIFKSTSISRTGGNDKMELRGDLTIVGITRNIKLDMQMGAPSMDPWGEEAACFTITGKITRDDWGLRWTKAMEVGGFLVGDEMIISCKIALNSMGQHDAMRGREPKSVMRVIKAVQ